MAHFLNSTRPFMSRDISTDDFLNIRWSVEELNYNKAIYSVLCPSEGRDQYCATSPQEAFYPSMTYPQPYGAVESLDSDPPSEIDAYLMIVDNYYQPYTIASCVTSDNSTANSTQLPFARLSQTESELANVREIVPLPNITIQEMLQTPGDPSQYRISWVNLPPLFQTEVPGMIMVHPSIGLNSTNSTFHVTTCTLNAGWGSSKLMTTQLDIATVTSDMVRNPPGWPPENAQEIDIAGVVQQGFPDFANISGYAFPEKHINISQNWAKYLNPSIQFFPGQNTTALDHIFSMIQDRPSEAYIARMASVWLANALTRSGAEAESNGMWCSRERSSSVFSRF